MTSEQRENIRSMVYESSQIEETHGNTRDDERISLLEDAILALLDALPTEHDRNGDPF